MKIQNYRKIIHIDMDAFFASVEQHDHPKLRGKPVIVGAPPGQRGVVSTASYEARKFGVSSGMSSTLAHRLCPEAIFVRPNFERYREVSRQIRGIFYDYTDLVEPISLDEAYLDLTVNKKQNPSATLIAKEIKQRILETTGLTASAGVSYCKFLAKIASDYRKPDGLTIITPQKGQEFIERLPIGKFFGVGPATEQRMKQVGIYNGADLKKWNLKTLTEVFGKRGSFFYYIARGIDNRPVNPVWERKSLGKEKTFLTDIRDIGQMEGYLKHTAEQLENALLQQGLSAKTITLKVRYANFTTITRSKTIEFPTRSARDIYRIALDLLLQKTLAGKRKVRLLGINLSSLKKVT